MFGGTGVVGLTCPTGAVHNIETPRLRLAVARRRAFVASWDSLDEEARYWHGARAEDLTPPDDGADPLLWHADRMEFLADDGETGRTVATVGLWRGEAGGYLVGGTVHAAFRRQGYGTEALTLVCAIAHRHLGIDRLGALSEQANEGSARWLSGCGFGVVPGPAAYTLPNGRVIEARWWERTDPEARARCRNPPW